MARLEGLEASASLPSLILNRSLQWAKRSIFLTAKLLVQIALLNVNNQIDPKRAIPREEQERTAKIFVGGVSQDATEEIFKDYFAQYGRVIDATLMMDKDTGRPRGFGFVTFDSEAAVTNTLNGDLNILGKPIEVKKAQPRGDMSDGVSDFGGRGRGRGGRRGGFAPRGNYGGGGDYYNQGGNRNMSNGMTPQMMAQYMARMQQLVQMQQQFAMSNAGGQQAAANPAMMQQMQQMMMQQQQMKNAQFDQQGAAGGYPQPYGNDGYNAYRSGGRGRGMEDDTSDWNYGRQPAYGGGRGRGGYGMDPMAAPMGRPGPAPGRGRASTRGFHPYAR